MRKPGWLKLPKGQTMFMVIMAIALVGLSLNVVAGIEAKHPFNGIKAGGLIVVDAPIAPYAGVNYPTIVIKSGKEEVQTTYYRCITVKPPLDTTGYLSWQLQTPRGTPAIPSPPTHSTRTQICENVYALHPLPPAVIARMQQLKSQGTTTTVWEFYGQVHADRTGPVVTTHTFSDPFVLVDDMP